MTTTTKNARSRYRDLHSYVREEVRDEGGKVVRPRQRVFTGPGFRTWARGEYASSAAGKLALIVGAPWPTQTSTPSTTLSSSPVLSEPRASVYAAGCAETVEMLGLGDELRKEGV